MSHTSMMYECGGGNSNGMNMGLTQGGGGKWRNRKDRKRDLFMNVLLHGVIIDDMVSDIAVSDISDIPGELLLLGLLMIAFFL